MRKTDITERSDTGIAAVIFDWAGTIVDFGCFAPTMSLVETFSQRGVSMTLAEARGPMGLEKRDHIRALLADPNISSRWKDATGADPAATDVDSLYEELEPRMADAVKLHAGLVPGVKELVDELRAWGVGIGTTTGYLRPLMDILTAEAERQGFHADAVICPSDVPAGRPYPWMCFLNAIRLKAYPPRRVVKIGDTPADMREGLNAGMWTVGVTLSGNEVGLSEADVDKLTPEERSSRVHAAERALRESGAHYVAETAGSCRTILARIEERIMRGDQPCRETVHEPA
ncbi:MAG TPA: phosphonoacetaldehyde hydrolase [Spirochaetia bacterium]|nr:phosphonoacetaldehyde hydrolase [Spirochaetia bacterium]